MSIYNEKNAKEQIASDKKTIGNNIRKARKNFKLTESLNYNSGKCREIDFPLTQKQLANKIGVSKNTISLLEKGISTPSLTRILEICQALNISIIDIFKDTSILKTPIPKDFADKYEALGKNEKTAVKDFLNFLICQKRLSNEYEEEKYSQCEREMSIFLKFLIKKESTAISTVENKKNEDFFAMNTNYNSGNNNINNNYSYLHDYDDESYSDEY